MFHHFGWKLPIQGQIFRVLGVSRVQISIFHFKTPKRHILARFLVFWAIARQNPSRGLFYVSFPRKKCQTKSYISPLCPEVPREQIFTKFGTNVRLVDVINPDKLCVNLFKGFDLTGVKVSIFSIGKWLRCHNSAALPRSLRWALVLGSQPAGDLSHKTGSRISLLSARLVVTFPAVDRYQLSK